MATVTLPRLLEPASTDLRFEVEGETVGEVLEAMFRRAPGLRVHLVDESGTLRTHVLCFVDGVSSRLEDRAAPVETTARFDFLQAVSGGQPA